MSHDDVYEMLWDCKYCGQKKLLGITHRFCAGCGGPQDPAARYFPPDDQKVAVAAHPYVGADVACPACRQPMARAAKCCTNCGSPIDKGADVALKADVVIPPPSPLPAGGPPPPAKNTWKIVLGVVLGVALLGLVLILVGIFWKREGAFQVVGHSWERNIAVERFEAVRKSVWCDDTPSSARVVGRRKEQKGTSKEKDGETCGMRKKDLGNGSYKEVKECTPKFKDVPVMADKCDVELVEWRPSRTLSEKGAAVSDKPRWPRVTVAGGTCLGCEREGARSEKYTVRFEEQVSGKKSATSCDLPEPRWASYAVGSRWKGKVAVVSGGVDCDTLVPQ